MDKDAILAQIIKSQKMERREFNHLSDSDSTYGCVIAETSTNTHMGEGIEISFTDLSNAIDLLTRTEIWELNIKLADQSIPLSLADSPGVKPGGSRPGRPN